MRASRDPEHAEITHIINACSLKGMTVLEIGSGHGQLTIQYSNLVHRACGLDPDYDELKIANDQKQESPVTFLQSRAEWLPFSSRSFDIVIFASSL